MKSFLIRISQLYYMFRLFENKYKDVNFKRRINIVYYIKTLISKLSFGQRPRQY